MADFFINMDNGIHNHFTVTEDAHAVSGVNWPQTLAGLIEKEQGRRHRGRVEINSHGSAAKIHLIPDVGLDNVHQFAALIGRLIAPGSMIEILACKVASFPFVIVQDAIANPTRAAKVQELRFDTIQQRPTTTLKPNEVESLVVQALAMGRNGTLDRANGPLFCANLANATGSTVRAAMPLQVEQGEGSGDRMYDTPIGDWEGHVLDFGPGDRVHYAGYNLPRPVFRVNLQPIRGIPQPA